MRLKIRTGLVLTLAAGGAALAAKPPAAPAPPSFGETVEVNVVNVDVYATDKSGKQVTDLRQGDFQVFEDGKPVEIANFEAVEGRRTGTEAPPASSASPGPTGPTLAPSSPEDVWNLVVLFDDFSLQPSSHARAVHQLREFLARGLAPGDRVMLVTLDPSLRVRLPFTGDQGAITRALDEIARLAVHGDEAERDRRLAFQEIMTIQEAALLDPNLPPCPQEIARPAHTYAGSRRHEVLRSIAGLKLMVSSLSGVPGRKAVVHVSDGIPLTPGEEAFQALIEICGGSGTGGIGHSAGPIRERPNGQGAEQGIAGNRDLDPLTVFDARELGPQAYQAASQGPLDAQSYNVARELEALAAHANAERVTLYTLQASGLEAPEASAAGSGPADRLFQFPAIGAVLRANNRDSLQLLADETGGRSILDTNDFLPDLGRIRSDFESYYSLGYTPAHNGDGREHHITVKVGRPGIRLRYRQSYRDKPTIEKTVDRTLAALLYGFEDNPLEIAVEVGEQTPGPSGNVAVPIRLKIPLFKLAILNHEAAGLFEGNLRLLVATRTPEGNGSPLRQVPIPIRIPRRQVLTAMGQFYLYTLTLNLQPGQQQVAIAVRDEIAGTTSYLSRAVTVGTVAAAGPSRP
jgi:VWFA-related protein